MRSNVKYNIWVILLQAACIRAELNFLSIQEVDFLPNSQS